ncbi:MAG: CHRD domain-containing protein [Chloroflexota bacterium]|nr:CHRD domain-containing protein [Chloroflexota bacterium]
MPRRRSHLIPATMAVALVLTLATGVVASQSRNFVTALSGAAEVPIRDTHARGAATFQLSADGTEVSYKVIASNIHNVFMAHIHLQAAGTEPGAVNGPIVVWLAPSTTPGVTLPLGGGRHDGVLATGTFTAANLVGTLTGQPLSALLAGIAEGRAYVNVHTDDGVAPTNTGPGDFPGGEVRGQLP